MIKKEYVIALKIKGVQPKTRSKLKTIVSDLEAHLLAVDGFEHWESVCIFSEEVEWIDNVAKIGKNNKGKSHGKRKAN